MNYALLWLDALIFWLVWTAFFAACIGRLARKWVRALLLVIITLIPVGVLGAFVTTASDMKFGWKLEVNWFAYAVSLLCAYILGAAIIVRLSRRRSPGLLPAAANWKPIPLALTLLIVAGIGFMALINMDIAIRARCALLALRVNTQYWAVAPAVTSESSNAAPLYEKVLPRLTPKATENIYNPPLGGWKTFNPNDPATVSFLNEQKDTLAMLREAAARPACRFDADLELPDISATLPMLDAERNAVLVLDLDAREQLAHGNVSTAINDAAAVCQMSRQFGQRPLEISTLMGFATAEKGNEMLERTLPQVRNPNDLAGLHFDELESIGRMLQQSLRGEEEYGLSCYGTMPFGSLNSMEEENDAPGMRLSATSDPGSLLFRVFFLDLNDYVELMETCQADAVQPYYKIRTQLPDARRGHWGMMTSILAPVVSKLLSSGGTAEARDACARAAVAMTQYRLDHGTLPAKLADLIPKYLDAIPTDPFNGQPLRLVIKNSEWIIYSLGPNGIDDNGVGYDKTHKTTDDVAFTLKATPASATTKP